MLRDIPNRGYFETEPAIFGYSHMGIPLEVWLPLDQTTVEVIVIGGVHGGGEPDTIKLLSNSLRSLKPEALSCAVVLSANPDGTLRGTRGNFENVDLNRNFPTSDWTAKPLAYKWKWRDREQSVMIRPGKAPSSEPETRAILNLISELKPKFIVSIHSPAACIDDPADTDIGRWLSSRTELPHLLEWDIETPGSLGTWGKENGLPVITYELPNDSLDNIMLVHEPVVMDLLSGSLSNKNPADTL